MLTIRTIIERLQDNDRTLTSLDLSHYHFSHEKIDGARATILANLLKYNTTVTTLNLSNNWIDAEGAIALADALWHNTTLTSLNLMNNPIRAAGANSLSFALKENSTLTSLNLYNTQIGSEGAKALADALNENNTLTSLNLGSNNIHIGWVNNNSGLANINYQCANALGEALAVNKSLKTLVLSNNNISDVGAEALATALKVNSTLTCLSLHECEISGIGANKLAVALMHNTSLTSLNLGRNPITSTGVTALAEALKVNTTLTSLSISFTCLKAQDVAILTDALDENSTLRKFDLICEAPQLNQNNFPHIKRKLAINSLAYLVKDAWMQSYQNYDDFRAETRGQVTIDYRDEVFQRLIESVCALDHTNDEREVILIQTVFEKLKAYLSKIGLDLEDLPDTSYVKEFVRLLAGRVNAMNVGDVEAQAMALVGLVQPFHDEGLRAEAVIPLIGLLNNGYFGGLPEGSRQKEALDLLILILSCQYPYERDLTRFALAAYARLGGEEITLPKEQFFRIYNGIIANFEQRLKKECEPHGLSREVLREKCLEELTRELIPAPEPVVLPEPAPVALPEPEPAPTLCQGFYRFFRWSVSDKPTSNEKPAPQRKQM